ncbi:MAG: hypothetical protein Q8P27_01925 [Candidatus Peregrinibacteria bacterium]|nr:hypothetical protein [Candidatus Peregrinibacteria bacterium]
MMTFNMTHTHFLKRTFTQILFLAGALAIFLTMSPVAKAVINCESDSLNSDQKLECLLIGEEELIEGSPQGNTADGTTSLPHGSITSDFLPFFVNTALAIAGTLIFISLLFAGYTLVFANDNEESIEKGKKILIYSVIGAVVIAISYAVIFGVANLDLD